MVEHLPFNQVVASSYNKQYEHALGAAMARDVRDEDTTLYADTLPYFNNGGRGHGHL